MAFAYNKNYVVTHHNRIIIYQHEKSTQSIIKIHKYLIVSSLLLLLLVCDRISSTSGQQQQQFELIDTSAAGFEGNYNNNFDNDDAGVSDNNELSKQFDLPGKQLIMDDNNNNNNNDDDDDDEDQQRRIDWPTITTKTQRDLQQNDIKLTRHQTTTGNNNEDPTAASNHQYISVLNNQSNIITSPSSSSSSSLTDLITSKSSQSNHTKAASSRFELPDPHLKEELDIVAQNGLKNETAAIERQHHMDGSVYASPASAQTNLTALTNQQIDLKKSNNNNNSSNNKQKNRLKANKKRRKKKKKKKLIYLNLLPYPANSNSNFNSNSFNPNQIPLHQYRYTDMNSEQRLIDYLSLFNSSIKSSSPWTIHNSPRNLQQHQQNHFRGGGGGGGGSSNGGELMVTSSSQPANEFETTMIVKPSLHNHEPIMTGNDFVSGNLMSESTTTANSISSVLNGIGPELNLHDTDEDDDDYDDSRDLEALNPKFQEYKDPTTSHLNLDNNNNNNNNNGTTTIKLEGQQSTQTTPITTTAGTSKATEIEQELLVGPFKSEAEAPATITLSGIVYQKSGVRSSLSSNSLANTGSSRPLRASLANHQSNGPLSLYHATTTTSSNQAPPKLPQEGENLSTSDSSSSSHTSSSSSSNSNNNNGSQYLKQQQQPNSGFLSSLSLDGATAIGGGPTNIQALSSYRLAAQNGNKNPRFSGLHELIKGTPSSLSASSSSSSFSPYSMMMNHYYNSNAGSGQQQQQQATTTTTLGLDPLTASTSSPSNFLLDDTQLPASSSSWMLSDGLLDSAASGKHSKKHQQPVVIVQKDVKPVKYHLMRAYLKLRRLLRPYEATYVFMN